VDQTSSEPRPRHRLEGRVRRTLELFFLGVTLLIGTVVVGGCGVAGLIFGDDSGPLIVLGLVAGGVVVVGIVYLTTSMSRDVRLLRAKLLEQEERERRRAQSDAPAQIGGSHG
jgi:hypothetical protein